MSDGAEFGPLLFCENISMEYNFFGSERKKGANSKIKVKSGGSAGLG